jgi:2-hydroxy-3-oxopropionate reductase
MSKTVILGKDGVLEGAKEGSVVIDMSSIAPAASQEVERACASKGVKMLDAPVSAESPRPSTAACPSWGRGTGSFRIG